MMNLKETYHLAIQNEIKSQILYTMLSKSFKDNPESSQVFKHLVPMEKMHEEKLRAAYKQEFPHEKLIVDSITRLNLTSVDIDEPKKVLEYAISREDEARDIYTHMANATREPDRIKLLKELATEEEYHRTVLETEIQRLQGMISWYDPSELSGLVEDGDY
jgi:rubrerythrin